MSAARIETVDVILPLAHSEDTALRTQAAARQLGVPVNRIHEIRLRKHSIDARKRDIKIQLRLEVGVDGPLPSEILPRPEYPALKAAARRVIIVGSGPAGFFAALRLIERGLKPIVLERGKDASARRFDLAPLLREGRVIEDSNYCFGEGGAGTFSDGKLYTRATKRGPVAEVYATFVAHGAPVQILVDSHPHIGSNLLPNVVKAMRESILRAGGEVHFGARVAGLVRRGERLLGVTTADGREFLGDATILATGHSARDIYRLLHHEGIRLEQKAFAVGVRIEHPQNFIDSRQYHYPVGQERPHLLPAASYRLATKIKDRGVHSFCMCPGGFIVPAATENDEVVVNGMSLSRRDSPFANSGLVVTVEPEDTAPWQEEHGVLAGIAMQKSLEQAAKLAGGGGQVAPGQRVPDFMAGLVSSTLNATSYFPGLNPARLDKLLPGAITWRMKQGLKLFGQQMPGYVSNEAQLIGCETRTSSPVRIPRDDLSLQHPEVLGLYPCGEGAGFAGGIVSAALDGIRCADAAVDAFKV
ncbi:MAG: FAD-binding protein [Cephaloticoccus sp.]|nr:FAD-binding protein [Cephaloticoccus sp.]MCF7761390.1 FAD-binding protein [Cephaloticoccus sp.]